MVYNVEGTKNYDILSPVKLQTEPQPSKPIEI